MHSLVIAIDGPAGAGKSTISKKLAERLNYQLLDTGAIYRSLAWKAQKNGIDWSNEAELATMAEGLDISFAVQDGQNRTFVEAMDVSSAIREPEISRGASIVSAHPKVRSALLSIQRRLGQEGGVVAEGRDIGSVVFPNADIKFFLTATTRERAKRRTAELLAKGTQVDYDNVYKEISERDERDSSREAAPLKAADDAILVDSSSMTLEQVLKSMLQHVNTYSEALQGAPK